MQFRTKVVCAITTAALVVGLTTMSSADPLKVKTAQGKVQGKTINDGKVNAFLGLPYAAPPVGDLRWKAPEPAAKWKGTRDAKHLAHHCAQLPCLSGHDFPGQRAERRLPLSECVCAGDGEEQEQAAGDVLDSRGRLRGRCELGAAAQRRLSAAEGRGAGNDQLPAGRLRLPGDGRAGERRQRRRGQLRR